MRSRFILPGLAALLAIGCLLALGVGSVHVPPTEILHRLWAALWGHGKGDLFDAILFQTRLPRILLAAAVGASLALAGVAAQSLFQNPLAGPHVIGVSNGAALGAVAGMLIFAGGMGGNHWAVTLCSLAGGIATTFGVFVLARRARHLGYALLLAGIAVGALCLALTAGALYLSGEQLANIVFWLMGGLWRANWREVEMVVPVLLATFLMLRLFAPEMNVALIGERPARDLGVNVARLQNGLIAAVAVPTAVAVSLTGVIGFIGLIVPHLMRMTVGEDHRRLVPASALGGAILLVIADTAARTLAAPAEVPVGILTALIGAPVFLWLLQRRMNRGGSG
jgi:iron complex transport system permease protein